MTKIEKIVRTAVKIAEHRLATTPTAYQQGYLAALKEILEAIEEEKE